MTAEQAEIKFQDWLQEKQSKIASKKNEYALNLKESRKKAHENEIKVNEAKAQSVARKRAEVAKAAEVPAPAVAKSAEEPAPPVAEEQAAVPVAEEPKQE